MQRYLCVHGHFYQPPRENPWIEEVELQDSAYPYHDWNDRITIECYAPNGASRILDKENKIVNIVNNYEQISFNFGPTLLSWMQRKRPANYKAIIEADKKSRSHFSGHGSALAQVYNHMIMPLANERDKKTQVEWGIKDFEYRFGRRPKGMWLAETAVDLKTLEVLADHSIEFTLLSPYQAKSLRRIGQAEWMDVSGGKVDPKKAYKCILPSGRSINLFFYDGPISQDIAFGGLLSNGENFANRLVGAFSKDDTAQIMHIATDGETYGHHHSWGEMALSYAYDSIDRTKRAEITVYSEFLEKFPPEFEVQIIENSSWSCFHGVERWRNDCGCRIGTHKSWNQAWRITLREAMDWLRDKLAVIYAEEAAKYLSDPWTARNNYIDIILNRSPESIGNFMSANQSRELSDKERTKVLKLLEMQRHAMLMYTSCGWFFDDVSGIETIQVMQYAARAIQLALAVSGEDLEPDYRKIIRKAKSNLPEAENGEQLYDKHVKPAVLDLQRVAAHYAVYSLFEEFASKADLYCYEINRQLHERFEAGKQTLVCGSIKIRSRITLEEGCFSYAVLHLGDHIVFGGVGEELRDELFVKMNQELRSAFHKSDVGEIISLLDEYFKGHDYSLWHLFRDEQRAVLNRILDTTLREIETSFRQINEHHYPIMLAMRDVGVPLPGVFANTFAFVMNNDIRGILEDNDMDIHRLENLIKDVRRWSLNVDKTTLGFVASKRIIALMEEFSVNPQDIMPVRKVDALIKALEPLALQLRFWEAQNAVFSIKRELYEIMRAKANHGDKLCRKWVEVFDSLADYLSVR